MKAVRFAAAAAGLALTAGAFTADVLAQAYPSRPIRVITQFTPGGPGDVLTRAVAQATTPSIGQPFVVENRPGAEGLIALEQCRNAPADGYNLCAADSFAVSLLPVISTNMQFDPLKELAPIVHMGFLSSLLMASPTLPVNTLQELLDLAKQKPGAITFGSWGPASSPHMYMEWLKKERGINFLEVPYKAAPFAWQGFQGGEVQVAVFATGPAMGQLKAGKLKALALINPARSSVVPSVPTLREAGMPVDVLTWFGLFTPTATPREIIQRVNAETVKSFFGVPALVEKYLTQQAFSNAAPVGGSAEAFAAFLKQDRDNNANLARVTGVKLDH
jgi:tripartite-type tricarboxylate transporter receptor subunit TctC